MVAVEVAADVHVGTPPSVPPAGPYWVTRKIHFHGFAGLPATRDEEVKSPEFSCFGHKWTVEIYPGGGEDSKEGYVAVHLENESPESIQAHFKILMRHPTDHAKQTLRVEDSKTFEGKDSDKESSGWGSRNFAKRDTIMTYLDSGTLTLEIHLRTNKQTEPTHFVPSNPFNGNMLGGFNSEEMSDVTFDVGGEVESATNRRKRAKTTATTFHAFHAVLRLNAPSLADSADQGKGPRCPSTA